MQKPVDERIGCAWAPKICYDETAWNYAVFFSGGEDGTTILKIFYCRTKDFLSYSEPCVQIEKSRELTEGYILIHPVAAGEKGVGYFPLAATSEQLEAGEFIRLSPAEYSLPEGCKHGSVLLITKAEYERLAVMFP